MPYMYIHHIYEYLGFSTSLVHSRVIPSRRFPHSAFPKHKLSLGVTYWISPGFCTFCWDRLTLCSQTCCGAPWTRVGPMSLSCDFPVGSWKSEFLTWSKTYYCFLVLCVPVRVLGSEKVELVLREMWTSITNAVCICKSSQVFLLLSCPSRKVGFRV
jgi:hypothetical protein